MSPVRAVGAARIAFEKYGVTDYVVDCDYELDKLLAETRQPKKLRIFVRIATPLGGAVLELSSKFGTTPAEAAKLRSVQESGAAPCITFHVGSQCLSPFSYAQAIEMARCTAALAKVEIAVLDIGGGFPGPYMGGTRAALSLVFRHHQEALETPSNPKIPVICEPGRVLIAEGAFIYHAGDPAQGRPGLHR